MNDMANLAGERVKWLTFLILISSSSFSAGCCCWAVIKKKELLVHLTMLNLEKKKSVSNLNWIISTNLGLGTIRGGDCDLNVCFPHLHLRNKLVKTFLVSRFVSRNHLVSKHSCIKLVLKCWGNMQKPTCSPGQGLMTRQRPSTLLVNSMLNNSSRLRIICIWNQCSPVLLKKGFPLALAWPGNVFKWHLQLDLPVKIQTKQHAQINTDLPKTRNYWLYHRYYVGRGSKKRHSYKTKPNITN